MKKHLLSFTVTEPYNGLSLYNYLQRQGFSKKLLIQLKQKGLTVNGNFHRMIDPITTNDIITVNCLDESTSLLPNISLKIPILHEDDDIIIFNKPINTLVHPCARDQIDALGNYFTALFPNKTFRPIGRLDRNTTGLCLVAKHQLAAALITANVDKEYIAIVEGLLPSNKGIINIPLKRLNGPKIRYEAHPDGLHAITKYQVINRTKNHTLLSIQLITGRTHQIRAHFAYMGFPLAGDILYGGKQDIIQRQALHCYRQSFIQPINHQDINITSPMPNDMQAIISPG